MKGWFVALGICAVLATPGMAAAVELAQNLDLPIADFDTKPAPPKQKGTDLTAKEKYNKPLYNPETKSYFEYYWPSPDLTYDPNKQYAWERAAQVAGTRVFHGVRGRLAVVKTAETNKFIVDHFQPNLGTWIGLRYFCNLQTLRWVTGEFWPLTAYQNWNRPWNLAGASWKNNIPSTCESNAPWMGVHYWGADADFKWNANGPGKGFGWMIVEYPTGKP